MFLLGDHPTHVLETLLERWKQVYIDNATHNSQIMPYDPRPAPMAVLFQTLSKYGGAMGFIDVCQLEAGPVFGSEVVVPGLERDWYVRETMRLGEAAYDVRRMR